MVKDILQELNDAQRKAVLSTDGPSMVIAGAGSGKTRVLTFKIAHLLNNGVDPFRILALTFTNKAAREMKERIMNLVGSADGKNVWMGTFHSIFARILRIEGHRMGYPANFTIYDADDSKRLVKQIIKDLQLDDKVYQPNMVLGRISGAKTNLLSPEDYNDNFEIQNADRMAGKPRIGEIYTIYNNRCKKADAMDFDDLLFNTNILFRDFEDALYQYQRKFNYILVDEYQDTNYAQYLIVKKLAANDENLCVVGDDAQSIYGFRGANIQNILNFKNDYPDHKIFKLEQNYRSTKTIVQAANSVIEKNKDQIQKEVWTANDEGEKIKVLKASTDGEEGSNVANAIFELKMNHQQKNDSFAILYRTNAQSRAMEEALRKLNIPYRIYGGLSFYKRKEIKDLLAYFRLVMNNKDEEALFRVINYPARGIGKTSLERLIIAADAANASLWEIIQDPLKYKVNLNSGIVSRINSFVTMIQSFSAQLTKHNAFDLAKHIATSSGILKDLYDDKSPEGLSRYENIEELLNAVKEFTESEPPPETENDKERTLADFMNEVSLLTDSDSEDKDGTDKVALMTIHLAKGLEFPYVFVVGLEENLFPSIQSLSSRADLEEERRLFYVALTRAEQRAFLSYAESRYRWGNLTICEPSRFIEEVDENYLELPQKARFNKDLNAGGENRTMGSNLAELKKKRLKKVISSPTTSTPVSDDYFDQIQSGIEVEHEKFGKGKVISVEGNGSSKKATVFFNGVGQKQLLLKFARLKVL